MPMPSLDIGVENWVWQIGCKFCEFQILRWIRPFPDLNPIEHIWDFIARQLAKQKLRNADELLNNLKVKWEKIPLPILEKLIDSMPQRLKMFSKQMVEQQNIKFKKINF